MIENDIRLCVDWVGLSLRLYSEVRDIPNHVWREYSATNVWACRRILYNEYGDKVVTLLSKPRSSVIDSRAALLEIENEWLYHGGGARVIIDMLSAVMQFEILGFSRLDLAADFCPDAKQSNIIRGLADGRYYVSGKRNGSGFWSTNNCDWLAPQWNGVRIPHCQSWGHKTSAIKWKLYYKTKELADAGGGRFLDKPYIVDQWRMAGFDIRNVWRLEVSLKHGNAFLFDGMRIDLDCVYNSRADVFRTLLDSRFQIRKNEGHKDRSNDTQVFLLDTDESQFRFESAPSKKLAEHNGRISLMRALVRSLDDEQVLLDAPSREAVFSHLESIIKRDGLQNYFFAMTGHYLEEYRDEMETFAAQKWAVRDALASPQDEDKGSQATASRSMEIPKPMANSDMRPNAQFEEQKTDAQVEYYKWFMNQLRPDAPPENPDWKLFK